MKNRTPNYVLISSLVIFSCLPLISQAATTTSEGQKATTTVITSFDTGTDLIKPVDPNNPTSKPQDVTDNGVTPLSSGLALAYVSKGISFGQNMISIFDATYPMVVQSNTTWGNRLIAEVGDARGTRQGWTLSVTGAPLSSKQNSNKQVPTIKGASVTFGSGTIHSSAETDNNKIAGLITNPTKDQTHQNVDPVAELQLDNSAGVDLLKAQLGAGQGMTTYQLQPDQVHLRIPANQAGQGTYTTEINWTLKSEPFQ